MLEESIRLLSLNLREHEVPLKDEKDPFSHNEKLKGVYDIATKLKVNNYTKITVEKKEKRE